MVDAAAVLSEGGALGEGVEAGEQGQAGVEDLGHGLGGPADAPQLEGEQGADGAGGGNHGAAGQGVLGEEPVEADLLEQGQEQEQAAEGGADPPGCEIELPGIGNLGHVGAGEVGEQVGRPAGEAGPAVAAQDIGDGGGADGEAVGVEEAGDVGNGELALVAELEDAAVAGGFVRRGRGRQGGRRRGSEEAPVGMGQEVGAEVAQGAGSVAEAAGGLGGGAVLDEAGAQGFVAAHGRGGGFEEDIAGVCHWIICTCNNTQPIINVLLCQLC